MKEKRIIHDVTLIGEWNDVKGLPLSSITKKDTDTAKLDGLVIKGYETKFGVTNENFERYDQHCLDKFVNDYFIEHNLNMVVDVQHSDSIDDQVGRVIYLEVNSVGFYFVAYIPRAIPRFDQIKTLLEEGILQGFSKYGYATDWDFVKKDDNEYMDIKEMKILSVSLVTAPANALKFESMGETIKNRLEYRNIVDDADKHMKKKSIIKSKH